ncbi:hypothetical protein L596_015949 [Steinernema carpocapsae]|uniref:Eukaryotic translation initiation factor 2A n=1 Tax=Steinernema carpocapsae TaxID=34508 RepID=A0A4U5NGJ2_STECR|nr:hypothetical protein L596_015949 [Steinernema carpocapsae]
MTPARRRSEFSHTATRASSSRTAIPKQRRLSRAPREKWFSMCMCPGPRPSSSRRETGSASAVRHLRRSHTRRHVPAPAGPEPAHLVDDEGHSAEHACREQGRLLASPVDGDEMTTLRLVGSELLLYKGNNFFRFEQRILLKNVQSFELSPGNSNQHLCCYIPGRGGQPAIIQLRRFDENAAIIGNKTFFKCDRTMMKWNAKGTAVLVMSITDVDAENKSYYGESTLYLMNVSGESARINMDKKGPVYQVEWNPNGKEFTMCYGFMPARIATYDLKGDVVWDLGDAHLNEIRYNRFGNILLTCGFGNLSAGKMNFYNTDTKELIVSINVPNTTLFEWAPDGQHYLTAQTSPRLRFENGYRIWHYTGKLVHEDIYSGKDELWQVIWRPLTSDVLSKFKIVPLTVDQKAQAGLIIKAKTADGSKTATVASGSIAKKAGYVPPHLRKQNGAGALKPVGTGLVVKAVVSEKEKKIRNTQKKIDEIDKLIAKVSAGEILQKNQMDKIEKRSIFEAELEDLKAAA